MRVPLLEQTSEADDKALAASINAGQMPSLAHGETLVFKLPHTNIEFAIENKESVDMILTSYLNGTWIKRAPEIQPQLGDAVVIPVTDGTGPIKNVDLKGMFKSLKSEVEKIESARVLPVSDRKEEEVFPTAEIKMLVARIMILHAASEAHKLYPAGKSDPKAVAQFGWTPSRLAKSFFHVLVEGVFKNLAGIVLAGFALKIFTGDANETVYGDREPFAQLSSGVYYACLAAGLALTPFTIPNQFNYAGRVYTPLSIKDADRMEWDWVMIYNKILEEYGTSYLPPDGKVGEDKKALYDRGPIEENKCYTRGVVTAVTIVETLDSICSVLAVGHKHMAGSLGPQGAFFTCVLLGLFVGLTVKSQAALRADSSIGFDRMAVEHYKKTGQVIPPLGKLNILVGAVERPIVKTLRILLPLLFIAAHTLPIAESRILNRFLTGSNGSKEEVDAHVDQHKTLVNSVKGVLALFACLGAGAKTVLFDIMRISSYDGNRTISEPFSSKEHPYRTAFGNRVAQFLGANYISRHADKAPVRGILGAGFFVGLAFLMERAASTAMDSLVYPYVSESTGKMLTTPWGPTNPLELGIMLLAVGATCPQTKQALKAFEAEGVRREKQASSHNGDDGQKPELDGYEEPEFHFKAFGRGT